MSVLIKGMKMPKNCNECPLCFYEGQAIYCCRALPAIEDGEILKPWKNKRKDCPLVEIEVPHGRLIDADALEQDAQKRMLICNQNDNQFQKPYEVMRAIALAPTIIPAEED